MKTRTIVLAKTGIFGSVDNPVVVTAEDLRQIAETFPDVKKAPIQLGHWGDPTRPRLGNVISATWDEAAQSLAGEVEEQDVLAENAKFYPDWSIGSKRRASDGKMYLHHLAYLGEEPPAIKDLVEQITQSLNPEDPEAIAASDKDGVILLPTISSRILSLADPAKTPQQPHPKEGTLMKIEEIKADPQKAAETILTLSDQVKKLEIGQTGQKEKLDALAVKYPDEELLLSDRADPRVTGLQNQLRKGKQEAMISAASGKLPKGKLPLLTALAGALPLSESIELSDGDAKTKVDGFALMTKIFEAMPSPVAPGRLDLGDPADEGQTKVVARDLLKNQ